VVIHVHLSACQPVETTDSIVESGRLDIVVLDLHVSVSGLNQVVANDSSHA